MVTSSDTWKSESFSRTTLARARALKYFAVEHTSNHLCCATRTHRDNTGDSKSQRESCISISNQVAVHIKLQTLKQMEEHSPRQANIARKHERSCTFVVCIETLVVSLVRALAVAVHKLLPSRTPIGHD